MKMLTRLERRKINIKGIDVNIDTKAGQIRFKRNNSELSFQYPPLFIEAGIEGETLVFKALGETKRHAQLLGTAIATSCNHIEGLTKGYKIELEIRGTGYKIASENKNGTTVLVLQLGYSNEVRYPLPGIVKATIATPTLFTLESFDKQVVYQTSDSIRRIRKLSAYKGKGIIPKGMTITLKETKKKK
jgi:large subunit ribosomal protein L6